MYGARHSLVIVLAVVLAGCAATEALERRRLGARHG